MSKQTNPTIIGAFVLGAGIIAILGISIFTSGQFFSAKSKYVVYFHESVNGLSVGALVKMQGVPIGKVTDIQVQLDPKTKQILTPVFIEIEHKKCRQLLIYKKLSDKQPMMAQLVSDGLRLQLQYTSLVTGKLYIETLLSPDSPISLSHLNNDFTELPAITSKSAEVQKNISNVIREVQDIDIKEFFSEIMLAFRNIKELTGSEDTRKAMHALSVSTQELQKFMITFNQHSKAIVMHADKTFKYSSSAMQKLDNATGPILADIQDTLAHTNTTLETFQVSANNIGEVFNKDALLQQNLNSTLTELRRAAKSLRLLADFLERHPEAIIRGK